MTAFFEKIMAFSTDGDELDKALCQVRQSEVLQWQGYHQTASDQERLAAKTRTRERRKQFDALLFGRLRSHQAPPLLRLTVPTGLPLYMQDCAGDYRHVSGVGASSFPVWKNAVDPPCWLFTDPHGNWAVAQEKLEDPNIRGHIGLGTDFKCLVGRSMGSAENHGGRWPSEMSYKYWDRTMNTWVMSSGLRFCSVNMIQ